jgi:hypothetical protein
MRIVWASAAMAGALLVCGCDRIGVGFKGAEKAAAHRRTSAEIIKDALAQRNFGEAAKSASAAVQDAPNDPELRLLQAKAEAQLGNGGNAARAFEQAAASGLVDPRRAAQDVAFNPVRDDPAFRTAVAKLTPLSPTVAPAESSTLRAGDVEIHGDTIRAGDVVVDSDQ